jgi:hypothetical protein
MGLTPAPCQSDFSRLEEKIMEDRASDAPRNRRLVRALVLLVPYVALLWLPFYNDSRPSFAGFPFFYWYQFLWVPITSLLLYAVYRSEK